MHITFDLFVTVLGSALLGAALIVSAWIRRRRLRDELARADPKLDDEAIETILRDGTLTLDDAPPLDLDEIAEEERRFWTEESWDSAEEY